MEVSVDVFVHAAMAGRHVVWEKIRQEVIGTVGVAPVEVAASVLASTVLRVC